MPTDHSPARPSRRILLWSATLLAILFPTVMHLRQTHAAVISTEEIEHATVPPRLDSGHPCLFATVTGSQVTPRLDQCATPTGAAPAVHDEERFEVDLRYGVFVLRQTDLHLTDDFDVPLTRSYVSQDWITANADHAFGHNTSHPFDIAPLGSRNPYTYLTLVLEDGDFLYFGRISPGTSFTDAVYLHTETSTPFYKATISWNGDGWTLKRTDGLTMRFPEAYNAKTTAQGAARERTNALGAKLLLHRDGDGNLQEIVTPHQRWMRFEHDETGHITRAEDDRSHWAKYTYNNLGMLTQVVNSSGTERHYQYDGVQITAITDGHGTPLLRNSYVSGILVEQHYANGDAYRFDYIWNTTRTFAQRAIVTFPDHSQRTIEVAGSVPDFIRSQ